MKTKFNFIRILTFIICLSLYSCDPMYDVKILNKSDHDVIVKIQLDKKTLPPSWDGRYLIVYFEAKAAVERGTLISTDTVNCISIFKLKPNEFFTVESSMGTKPNFSIIKSIHIFDRDTIILNSKEKMFELFKEKKERNFEFEIK